MLYGVVRKGFTDIARAIPEESGRPSHGIIWRKIFARQREQQVQRPGDTGHLEHSRKIESASEAGTR